MSRSDDGVGDFIRQGAPGPDDVVIPYMFATPRNTEIILIGLSWGGDTASKAAAAASRRVDILVTVDAVSFFRPDFDAVRRNSGVWINIFASGPSSFDFSNIIAGIGSSWDSGVERFVSKNFVAPNNHYEFGAMLSLGRIAEQPVSDFIAK